MRIKDAKSWVADLLSPAAALRGADQPDRFYLLDAARAIVALAVLFWHYQHFFIPINERAAVDYLSQEPLFGLFGLFYEHGHLAVPIFWLISGFVFARVYLTKSATTVSFALNRFARLYPLHLLTLCIVATLQAVCTARFGTSQIFGNNDLYHFVPQLFFASNWGRGANLSFNAPIWSVSVEVLIYGAFWVIHRRLARFGVLLPLLLAAGLLPVSLVVRSSQIAPCGYHFFLGCALYLFYSAWRPAPRLLIGAALALAALGIALLVTVKGPLGQLLGVPTLFGPVIVLIAVAETRVPRSAQHPLAKIGDTTYGMYLWHIPVQLCLFLALGEGLAQAAKHPAFLLMFLTLVIVISRLGYVWYERPAREWLRSLSWRRREQSDPVKISAP